MSRANAPLVPADPARPVQAAQNHLAAAQGAHAEQPVFRLDLRRSLEIHRKLVLGFIVAGILLSAGYLARHWPIYSAEALVYIQPTPSAPLGSVAMHWPYNYDPNTYESYIQQQMLSMTRPDVLKNAVSKLGNDGWRKSGESDQEAVDRLGSSVEVARVQSSYQVAITASSTNAQTAADMANAVASAYIESTAHEQRAGDSQRMAILRDERDRLKKELAGDRAEQAALNAQLGVAAVGPATPDTYDNDIAAIHAELVKARADHDAAEAQLSALDSDNSAALNAAAEQITATDSGLNSLKAALDTRRAALVSQMANLTPNHPLYKQDAAELAKIDANLQSATKEARSKAVARVQDKLRANLTSTAAVEDQLNGELNQMTRAATGATPKLQRAADLASDITRLQARYNALDDQVQNQTIEDAAPERAHVTNPAVAPLHPSERGAIRNAGVLLVGFMLLGLAAAVLAHKLDPHVYIASDVEQILGFAPMAMLPDFRDVSDGVVEEHLLRLASSLEHARRQGDLNTCIFTGTGPGTGTTTIAAHVRSFLESMGKPAAWVDATLAVPHEFEETNGAQRGTRSLALLQSMTAPAENEESLVLTDSAPLTLSAETEHLARNVDCAIVVMESGVTTRAELRATAAALARLDVGTVGFVLNRVRLAKADKPFRDAVRAVEQHRRLQKRRAAAEQPVRTRRVEAERPAAPKMPVREPQMQAAAPPLASGTEFAGAVPMPPQVSVAAPGAAQSMPPASLPAAQEAAPADLSMPELPQVAESEMPWWLSNPTLHEQNTPAPVARGRVPQELASFNPTPREEKSAAAESRLSGLRNIFRVTEVQAQRPQPLPPAEEAYMPAEETFMESQPLPRPHAFAEVPEPQPPLVQEPLIRYRGEAFVPYPESKLEPAPAAPAPRSSVPHQVTAVPEFLPPRNNRGEGEGTRLERSETVDEVAVLPSWRGQYRRKS